MKLEKIENLFLLSMFFISLISYTSLFDAVVMFGDGQYLHLSIENYVVLFILGVYLIFYFYLKKIKFVDFSIFLILFLFLVVNTAFSKEINWLWITYQIFFWIVSFFIYRAYLSCFEYFNDINLFTFKKTAICFCFVVFMAFLWLIKKNGVQEIYLSYNVFVYPLYDDLYWRKQPLGTFLAITSILIFTLFKSNKKYFFIALILFLGMGIRTLWLGSLFVYGFCFFSKFQKRKIFYIIFCLCVMSVFFLSSSFQDNIRKISYLNAIDISINNFFGIGFGNYHSYSFTNGYEILNKFYYSTIGFEKMSVAPESDIVFTLGSFGFSGLIYYCFCVYLMLFFLDRLNELLLMDKFFVLMFVYFFGAGLSQEYIFSLSYWIFFGFCYSIYKRLNFLNASYYGKKIPS